MVTGDHISNYFTHEDSYFQKCLNEADIERQVFFFFFYLPTFANKVSKTLDMRYWMLYSAIFNEKPSNIRTWT